MTTGDSSLQLARSGGHSSALFERGAWTNVPIARIEDLKDAVLGAGLEAIQMSRGPISGDLAFATDRGVTYSSGLLNGNIALSGPLSETSVTIGVGLRMPPGSRHWLNEIPDSAVGVFLPGDVHEALYTPGALYATATLDIGLLEEIAAGRGLVLDARRLGGTGISRRTLHESKATLLRDAFTEVHQRPARHGALSLGRHLLDALIDHLAREPQPAIGAWAARQHGRVVERARRYILEHLELPLSIDAIADAAFTSRRTLHRAFVDVLNESPQTYVRKLRLNRIRHDLATEREAACTIAIIAHRWGISELGRLSGWYRELFGELPSETRARHGAPVSPLAAAKDRLAHSA
jgi:AraC-like DNA-binding protein